MRVLVIDKDGTLVTPTINQYVENPWEQAQKPRAREAIARYVAEGWHIIIATNQAGVERGHKTFESTCLEMLYCMRLFPGIKETFFCPDFAGLECWRVWGECKENERICYKNEIVLLPQSGYDALEPDDYVSEVPPDKNFRKPGPGMLNLAIELNKPTEILYVGDHQTDKEAADAAGVPFEWAHNWLSKTVPEAQIYVGSYYKELVSDAEVKIINLSYPYDNLNGSGYAVFMYRRGHTELNCTFMLPIREFKVRFTNI